jgi:aspartyl/asparaginyl beta-hydroxylase (cupin superfamily)
MNAALVALLIAAVLAAGVLAGARALGRMSGKQKKRFLKRTLNGVFVWLEDRGLLPRTPAFDPDYLRSYPALGPLEENYAVVREECLKLLEIKEKLTDMKEMGGSYTQAGIHTAKWKTFMFKSGEFVEPNCRLCPKTAELLRGIPEAYTAFFSVLDPQQHVVPHWGYYKGFVRYHLGVVIPKNNTDRSCFLRVNGDPQDNALRDPALVEKGEVYYWHDGEGIVFDDNYLHEAENRSDEVRVVLWIDLLRRMPLPVQLFNRLCLWFVHRDRSVKKFRENALVTP